jgi:RimJ/RimL family protein N-acetyltransferase
MINFSIVLENSNILLRPMELKDCEDFFKITSSKSLWIYFTSDLSIKRQLTEWVKTALMAREKEERLPFTIINKPTNEIIGSSSFGNISYRDRRIEIGWTWLAKEYQAKGFNQQIKYLMLKYAFETLNMERIEFKTDVLNNAARKALIKIGCTEEGILRSHTLMINDRRRDTIYYSILKSEWPGIKQKNRWN